MALLRALATALPSVLRNGTASSKAVVVITAFVPSQVLPFSVPPFLWRPRRLFRNPAFTHVRIRFYRSVAAFTQRRHLSLSNHILWRPMTLFPESTISHLKILLFRRIPRERHVYSPPLSHRKVLLSRDLHLFSHVAQTGRKSTFSQLNRRICSHSLKQFLSTFSRSFHSLPSASFPSSRHLPHAVLSPPPAFLPRGDCSPGRSLFLLSSFSKRGLSGGYVDGNGTRHFRTRRGQVVFLPQGHKWSGREQQLVLLAVAAGATCFVIYVTHLEEVPYTGRTHFVLFSPEFEKEQGEIQFKQILAAKKAALLPRSHPLCLKVARVAEEVVRAALLADAASSGLQSSAAIEESHGDAQPIVSRTEPGGVKEVPRKLPAAPSSQPTSAAPSFRTDGFADEGQPREGEAVLHDKWGEAEEWGAKEEKKIFGGGHKGARRAVRERRKRRGSGHLKELKWEVAVIDEPILNAFCLPGGKIVVFKGLLNHFQKEEDIATIVGHEVGHVIARHGVERMSSGLFLVLFELLLLQFIQAPELIQLTGDVLFSKPFSRMHEIEADRIGLLLMASAGFDPTIAPTVYERLEKAGRKESGGGAPVAEWSQYMSTHPSGQRRAQLLSKADTMSEARRIYDEVRANEEEKARARMYDGFALPRSWR